MKLRIIAVILLCCVAACKKDDNTTPNNGNNNNPNTNTVPEHLNLITVTDEGKTYSAYGYGDLSHGEDSLVSGNLYLNTDATHISELYLLVQGGKTPFKLDIDFNKGPVNGLGRYIQPLNIDLEFENYYNGKAYTEVDSAFAEVKEITDKRVKGTFDMWLVNQTERRKVSGTFDFMK